jgi:predicted transcriptional regulator
MKRHICSGSRTYQQLGTVFLVLHMVRRDRHDIAVDILKKAVPGKKKTELMAEVGLSYLQTKQYLDTLVEKGLLEIGPDKQLKTTKKGTDFLDRCGECLLFPWEQQKRKPDI